MTSSPVQKSWNDIILPPDTKKQLLQLNKLLVEFLKEYNTSEISSSINRGKGITAVFTGQDKTSKNMAAEILSNQGSSGILDIIRIDLSKIVQKYIGETEKNLNSIFGSAENSGAILFFDEADALFGKRTDISDAHDRYDNIELDFLLQHLEAYPGLVIMATNRKYLDTAFPRRIQLFIDFPILE